MEDIHKKNIVSGMILELYNSFTNLYMEYHQYTIQIINKKGWDNFIGFFRYLGGTSGTFDANGYIQNEELKNFITSGGNGKGLYDIKKYMDKNTKYNDISYENPGLIDFVPDTYKYMKKFKDGNLIEVVKDVKIYIEKNHPDIAIIFQKIATEQIFDCWQGYQLELESNTFFDPNQDENVNDLAMVVLSRALMGINLPDFAGVPSDVFAEEDIYWNAIYKLLSPVFP